MRRPSARIISPFSTRVFKIQVTFVGALSASSTTRTWPNFTALTFEDRTFIVNKTNKKKNESKRFKNYIPHCFGFVIDGVMQAINIKSQKVVELEAVFMDLHQKILIITERLTAVITLFSCSILISPMLVMFTFYTRRKGRIKTSIDISNREVKGLWGQRGMIVIINTGYQNTALVVALKECTVLRDQYV